MRKRDQIEIVATGLIETGHGVAKTDSGVEVRVPDLLPDERARVVIEHVSQHTPVAWARIEARLGPQAAMRVPPPCPAFGRCGGCVWQHLRYTAQLEHKRRRVVDALAGAGVSAEVESVVAAPTERGYRNKGKYVVGRGPILGAYLPRTHEVVDTAGCAAVAPAIDRAAARVRDALTSCRLEPYDERQHRGHARYVVIRTAEDGTVLVGLVTTSDAPRDRLAAVAAALLVEEPVGGVVWLRNDATTGAIFDAASEPILLAGSATLVEHIAGVRVDVGITEFLQVNRAQATRLYEHVARCCGAGPGRRALDLYCGVGGISFALARTGARVLGVESHGAAVAAARRAAQRADLGDRVVFRAAQAHAIGEIARTYAPDIVVVDPPRKGLEPAVRAVLAALSAEVLVYVSCDPRSLARDLAHLGRAAGYRAASVTPYDLMPGTAHIETLAVCRR